MCINIEIHVCTFVCVCVFVPLCLALCECVRCMYVDVSACVNFIKRAIHMAYYQIDFLEYTHERVFSSRC